MKNRPFINQLVKLLLLLQISSFGVYCDEVKVVRIRILNSDYYLNNIIILATGQVLALDRNDQAKTQKNEFLINQKWSLIKIPNLLNIINRARQVILGPYYKIGMIIEVLFERTNVFKIKLPDSEVYLACFKDVVYKTNDFQNDGTKWIKIKDSKSDNFYLFNAAKNTYLAVGTDNKVFATSASIEYNKKFKILKINSTKIKIFNLILIFANHHHWCSA